MEVHDLTITVWFATGIAILLLSRKLYQLHQLRTLQTLHACKAPPSEHARCAFDPLGIFKALEVARHLRDHTFLEYTNALFQNYGETYTSHILGHRFIFTHNTANINHIMNTGFSDFDTAPLRKHLFEPAMPGGIFTLDGPEWWRSREELRVRLARPRNVVDLDILEELVEGFLESVPGNGRVFELQERVFALSLNIQTRFFLGESESVDALDPEQSEKKRRFVADLLAIKERIVQDGFKGPIRHLYFPSRWRFLRACRRVRGYVDACAARQTSSLEERRLFNDQVLSILLANDSMGTTLSGLFFALSRDERVVKRLRQSILATVGYEPPTCQQLNRLQYVKWAIQEALRLYPPAAVNARLTNKHTIFPKGGGPDRASPILVKKGDIIVLSTWARHRLGTEFGPDAETFRPERWEKLTTGMPGFIPFNKGPRICPELHAIPILTYVVTRVFQTYSTVISYDDRPWKERISVTLENENGVYVGLR